MATLLLKLTAYFLLNRTIFPPKLYVYDDFLVYKKRCWFVIKEITIAYNQISQVTLDTGIIFGHLKVSSTGVEDIHIKYLFKGASIHAKKIIDQKVYHAHSLQQYQHPSNNKRVEKEVKLFERSLQRLQELNKRGKISKKEMKRMKKQYLKDLG